MHYYIAYALLLAASRLSHTRRSSSETRSRRRAPLLNDRFSYLRDDIRQVYNSINAPAIAAAARARSVRAIDENRKHRARPRRARARARVSREQKSCAISTAANSPRRPARPRLYRRATPVTPDSIYKGVCDKCLSPRTRLRNSVRLLSVKPIGNRRSGVISPFYPTSVRFLRDLFDSHGE